jgi:hypothetical protein
MIEVPKNYMLYQCLSREGASKNSKARQEKFFPACKVILASIFSNPNPNDPNHQADWQF